MCSYSGKVTIVTERLHVASHDKVTPQKVEPRVGSVRICISQRLRDFRTDRTLFFNVNIAFMFYVFSTAPITRYSLQEHFKKINLVPQK